jgi:DNA repair protein SbcD/Mre11
MALNSGAWPLRWRIRAKLRSESFRLAFRFLHTADLHLDSPLKSLALRSEDLRAEVANATRQAFLRIIETCLERKLDALLIAGDLYDGEIRDMATPLFLGREFRRLDEAGIRVFLIGGNHDAASTVTRSLSLPENVKRFSTKGETVRLEAHGVAIHGMSFAEPAAPKSLLPFYPAPVDGMVNVGMLHTSIGGSEAHSVYAPCSLAELVRHGYDYWALGHIHKRQVHHERPFVVMPGMPQGRDIGESGPKSATLVTISDDGNIALEEIPTSIASFERVEILLEDADWDQLARSLQRGLAGLRKATTAEMLIVRPVLVAPPGVLAQLDRDPEKLRSEAHAAAEAGGRVLIDKLEFTPRALEVKSAALAGPLGEMAAMLGAPPAPALMAEAVQVIKALDAALPAELRGFFGADDAAIEAKARELLAEGGMSVLARIEGAEPMAEGRS